jgi:hypothetical protein
MVGITDAVTGYTTLIRGIGPNVTVNSGIQIFDFALTPAQITGLAAVTLGYGNVTCPGFTITSGNPYPEEFLGTNTPPWTDTKPVTGDPSTLWYAYLIVTVNQDPAGDGSQPPVIESISWDVGSSMPSDDPTRWTYYMLLGTGYVSADGKTATVLNQTGIGSQIFGYCGGDASAGGTGYWDPAGPAAIP